MPARQSAAMDRAVRYVVRNGLTRAEACRKAGVSWRALHAALKRIHWVPVDSKNQSISDNR